MPDETPKTIDEAAEIMGVTPLKVRELIASGQIPAIRLGHRTVRVLRSDIDALIQRCRQCTRAS